MLRQTPPELSRRVQRRMHATPLQRLVRQRLEDRVAPLVRRLKQVVPARLEDAAHLADVPVDAGDVLEQVEAEHHVERSVLERQLLGGLHVQPDARVLAAAVLDGHLRDVRAADVEALFRQLEDDRADAAADLQDSVARLEQVRLGEEIQVRLEVAPLLLAARQLALPAGVVEILLLLQLFIRKLRHSRDTHVRSDAVGVIFLVVKTMPSGHTTTATFA